MEPISLFISLLLRPIGLSAGSPEDLFGKMGAFCGRFPDFRYTPASPKAGLGENYPCFWDLCAR